MSITIELANIFSSIYIIFLMLTLLIYIIIGAKSMAVLTLSVLIIDIFIRTVGRNLLHIPNAMLLWYIIWMIVALIAIYTVTKLVKKCPNIQKIGVPIAFLWFLEVILNSVRYFERNFFDVNYFKTIYAVGQNAVSYLTAIYLFAPIALLLVKSIRGRISAKH